MPSVFLSPSTQEFNPYVDGGNEEYYMNIITDALIPYLEASGIEYERNDPSKTFANSVRMSNEGNFDLHLALHSNASTGGGEGRVRGSQVYYYPGSEQGTRAANIFANNLKEIYPLPEKVSTVPTTTLAEIIRTRAPAILIEIAFHDNPQDAQWIRDNIGEIAENLSISISDFLGISQQMPSKTSTGRVNTNGSNLNIRESPSIDSQILGRIPDGTVINLLAESDGWYLTLYKDVRGYVSGDFITKLT